MRRSSLVAAVLLLVGALVAVRPVAAAPLGDLKALTATVLKGQKDFDKQRIDACSAEITAVEAQVKLGLASAPQGLESASIAAGGCIDDLLGRAIEARKSVFAGAENTLAAQGGIGSLGFLVGDGSILDQFMVKLNAELEKARKRLDKRLRAYAGVVGKATDGNYRHTIVLPPLRMDVAPAPNVPGIVSAFEDVTFPPRTLFAMAGSSTVFPTDGKLCVSGRGYISFGAPNVNVGLFGVTAPAPRLNLAILGGVGSWHTCFTNIPIGNFRIVVDQDPNHDATFLETAPEYTTIGIP